ncbi:MAG: four-helix bundle copper-binding protein [Phycisphaerales bacterium]|nr:four-helix bundle copper-binding protein [Phycisphaerales bacterium]
MVSELEKCAHICHECEDACLGLIPHGLARGGAHAGDEHIGMLIDCAVICNASHSFLHRRSLMHRETCRACAAICEACAEDCERIAHGDALMTRCAEACRRCAESCRRMSS